MYETDLERLTAQAQRIYTIGTEVLEDTKILTENNADPSTAPRVGEKQSDLQDELEKAISNFAVALERSDSVSRRPEYEYGQSTFSAEYDVENSEIVFTYNGDVDLTPGDISVEVLVGGSVQNSVINGKVRPGDSFTVDVSGESAGTEVELRWHDKAKGKGQLPNQARAPIDRSPLPADDLVATERDFSISRTVE